MSAKLPNHAPHQKRRIDESEKSQHPQMNQILGALSPEVQSRLFSRLELVKLPMGGVMYECGQRMKHVYFPTDSIVSLQYIMENGASTAILVVGKEGLVGVTLFMGGEGTPSRTLVQSPGYAYRLPRSKVKEEFNRHGELLMLMLRYTQAMIAQITQTAVCYRHHSIEQQLCRWLLLSLDRLSDHSMNMTQEFISNMLGVRRESITQAARKLQEAGIIDYRRGKIDVLDRAKLEAMSCECYSSVIRETKNILNYAPQRQIVNANDIPVVTLPTSENVCVVAP